MEGTYIERNGTTKTTLYCVEESAEKWNMEIRTKISLFRVNFNKIGILCSVAESLLWRYLNEVRINYIAKFEVWNLHSINYNAYTHIQSYILHPLTHTHTHTHTLLHIEFAANSDISYRCVIPALTANIINLICGNKMPTRCNRRFLLQILLLVQHVSGTTMPIIRSSRLLYRRLLPVVFGALVFKLSVWYGAEGYVCGLRAHAHLLNYFCS